MVFLRTTNSSLFASIGELQRTLFLRFVVCIGFSVLIAIYQIRRQLVPIEKLKLGTEKFAVKDFGFRVQVASGDEFADLANAMNAMAAQLGQQFETLETTASIDRAVLSLLDTGKIPIVYAQATAGRAGVSPDLGPDLQPLFDVILKQIPAPKVDVDAPLQVLVTMLGYDDYRGVTAIGRVFAGTIKAGQRLARMATDGRIMPESAKYLYTFQGLNKIEIEAASAGDIISLAGLEGIGIGETLADPANPIALPTIKVEEPTVRMTFGVNTSPFAGKEGKWGTSRRLRERLYEELRTNVALRVEDTESAENFLVSGRGELHLGILIETMRREGYEFQVSRPEVIFHKADDGALLEPFEEVHIETSNETVGTVVEMLGSRRAFSSSGPFP